MNAPQYKPGGAEWHKVEAIIKACSCSRLRAVSALKACNNDQDRAIDSLDEALFISKPSAGRSAEEIPITDSGTTAISTLTENFKKLVGVKKDPPPETSKKGDPYELHGECAPTIPQGDKDTGKETAGWNENTGNREAALPPKYRIRDDPPHPPLPPVSNTSRSRASIPNPNKPKDHSKDTNRGYDDPEPLTRNGPQPPAIIKTPLSEQWDLHLPLIKLGDDEPEFTAEEGLTQGLSIRRLITALQTGMKRGMLQHYLAFFSESVVEEQINAPVEGFPAIFYAVATNDDKVVRTWVNNGGNVNAIDDRYGIPLLAFAIMMADAMLPHTTAVVTTLLSLGADVSVIPRCFFTPFLDDPPIKSPFTNTRYREFEEPPKAWCVDYLRPVMARSVNLTQRYFLNRTLSEKRPSERQIQVAITHHALSLLGIGYFMVGQSSAAKMVIQKSLSQMALPKSKPLVMVFSGPSGHGKTELAKRMGELLSLELECIDCTELRYETDLFGPKKPYIGHELGSPLNNFLTRLSGRRCIVFLDEFEKTTTDVQNSLLIPFDEGKYTDRRNRQAVDCSKTIWIMATNALDDTILDFCDVHQEQVYQMDDSHRHAEIMAELSAKLKKQLKSTFGNPLSGRVSLVVPFLPFSTGEQAVVAHKYMLDLQEKVRQSIQISGQQLVGRIILHVKQDGAICKLIAGEGYDASQGARSLKAAVETRIEDELVQRYLEEDGRIEDWQPLVRYTVDLSRNGILSVFRSAD